MAGVPNDHSRIVFVVGSAQSRQMLPGVTVSMVGRDGTEVELGETDTLGRVAVPKTTLREHDARFVLFSRKGFFTGAVRIGGTRDDLYSYDERYIQLAVLAVI